MEKGLLLNFTNDHIVCIGEVLWDVFPKKKIVGGAPLNVAVHLAKLQNSVDIVSKVGNDAKGKELSEFIRKNHLSTKYIGIDLNLPTSEVLVTLDNHDNASYEISEPVAWDQLRFDQATKGLSNKAGITVYGTLASRNSVSSKTILNFLNSNSFKLIDVNLRPPFVEQKKVNKLIKKADAAKLNSEELTDICNWHKINTCNENEMIKHFSEHYELELVCVTKGENGAVLFDGSNFFAHDGYNVIVKDTVGSGDAFLAGFIHALLKKEHYRDVLKFACAMGAYVASQNGATPGCTIKDIENIMVNT